MSARKRTRRPKYLYVLVYRGATIRSNVPSLFGREHAIFITESPPLPKGTSVSDGGMCVGFANGGYVNVATKDHRLDDCEIIFRDGTKVVTPSMLPRLAA